MCKANHLLAQSGKDKNYIEHIVRKQKSPILKTVFDNVSNYRLQIIFTQINRDKKNSPQLKSYTYRVNSNEYYYPASTVKLPILCMALEKLNNLKINGLNKNTRLQIGNDHSCQQEVKSDSSAKSFYPSIAHYVKKILLVSDNDAYNRLFEFLGLSYIHKRMNDMGYVNTAIFNRLTKCSSDENRFTNSFTFYHENGATIYTQAATESALKLSNPATHPFIGKAYIDTSGKKIEQPKDFSMSNCLPLQDLDAILKSIIFPEITPEENKFNLTADDYNLLYKYMSMFPSESDYPNYGNSYLDSWKKYFIYGNYSGKIENKNLRIFNIVGRAYGFLIDCAYIVDFDSKTEFMLSSIIYVNKDGVLNDDVYEYLTVGLPFLAELGNTFLKYEKKRKKKYLPNLEKFKFTY